MTYFIPAKTPITYFLATGFSVFSNLIIITYYHMYVYFVAVASCPRQTKVVCSVHVSLLKPLRNFLKPPTRCSGGTVTHCCLCFDGPPNNDTI
jgi:hypothetical protein